MFDPAGVHQHAGGMEDRVQIGKPGLEHARRLDDLGMNLFDEVVELIDIATGEGREHQLLGIAVETDGGLCLQPREVGNGHRLAGLHPIGITRPA